MKIKNIILFVLVGMLITGCSGETKPPTCEVYVESNRINVVITLPAEGMDYKDINDLTPSGMSGTPSKVSIESGLSAVEYSQTGNSYHIEYGLTYEEGEITD